MRKCIGYYLKCYLLRSCNPAGFEMTHAESHKKKTKFICHCILHWCLHKIITECTVWYWECEIKLEADTTSVSSVPIPGKPRGIELCTIWGHYTNIYIMLEIRGWSEHFRDYFRYSQCLYSFLWKQGKVSGLYRVLELKYLFRNTYKSKLSGIDKYFLFWEMSVHYSFLLELYLNDVKNLF